MKAPTAVPSHPQAAAGSQRDVTSSLRITEIFHSLQGESSLSGWPTVFVRLTGCPLRCQYCDTAYAFHGGQRQTLDDILDSIDRHQCRHVCVTGGEPLAQPDCLNLLSRLCDRGHVVSLETSGALPVATVDPRVIKILDIKTPGSGEQQRNHWPNLKALQAHDEIKFVICDRADYDWAAELIRQHELQRYTVWLSPSHAQLAPRELAAWMLADQLPARLQLQLHKHIWGDVPGH